ncbi:dihydrolipoyl dehydrogenase family protein [Streptomyces aidingensis]|uniref:dihydrolipoyl dehydrogenase family protein n=1 Tax=Streptomyces aidingensis TaxID=910347 RepID=UPI001FE5F070|nr:FAD-dependent oxidoreductase [Streptomyces aidingensis]
MPVERYDVVVAGGGSAGLTGARAAARLGARVLLAEVNEPGGDCLWTGCVPSKALLHAAARGEDFGAAMAQVRRAVAAIAPHDSARALEAQGVAVVRGRARFTGPRTLEIEGGEEGIRRVRFRYALIATGSAPSLPPVPGLAGAGPLTSDTVWEPAEPPERLVVLGGGPIGCELGQAFARLGARVTVAEMADRLLPREEPAAGELLRERLEGEGVTVLTGFRAERVTAGEVHGAGGRVLPFGRLLVTTGRTANTSGLGLAAAGVAVTGRDGEVRVDSRLRTANRRIYAAGDVTGRSAFTHTAGAQAAAAVTHALLGLRRGPDLTAAPWVTFTDPEVARVGMSAAQAREKYGERARVRVLSHERVDRAVADGRTDGFATLVIGPGGRIVGATVVAPRAGETIAHLATAVRLRWTAGEYAKTVHPYPTYADGPWQAALEEVYASLASPGTRRATIALLALRRALHR